MAVRRQAAFSAAGRTGAAHIMQLGAVGVERRKDEMAEEIRDLMENAGTMRVAVGGF